MNGTVYVPVSCAVRIRLFTYSSLTLQGENSAACRRRLGTERLGVYCDTKVIENTIDNYKDNTSGSDRS